MIRAVFYIAGLFPFKILTVLLLLVFPTLWAGVGLAQNKIDIDIDQPIIRIQPNASYRYLGKSSEKFKMQIEPQ
jgi:hypothetical protein